MDDDECDKIVFEILNRADNKYFKISDSIRNQIRYWKDRRNDCAHLKDNKIESSHVEAFWLFLSSNLNKITVVGSSQDLINRIKNHFNEDYTPLGTDLLYLIHEIPKSVEVVNFAEFLVEVKEIMKKAIDKMWYYAGEDAMFFYKMISTLDDGYYDIVKNYIFQNNHIAVEMFVCCPEFLTYYKYDKPQYVRSLWKNNLIKNSIAKIACVLLRNAIIPDTEINEFIEMCAYNNKNQIPKEEEYKFLKMYGYVEKFDYIINKALTEKLAFEWWVKENPNFIEFYFKLNLKNKNLPFVDMILGKYSNDINDKSINAIFKSFSKVINSSEELMAFVKERSNKIGFDLDDFLFLF